MFFTKNKKKYFMPIIAIILFVVVFIIVFVLIKYIRKVDGFYSIPVEENGIGILDPSYTVNPSYPMVQSYPSDILSSSDLLPSPYKKIQILPSIGPCDKVIIRAANLNLAGILILNQWGNNIFNNDYVKLAANDIDASYVLMNFEAQTTSSVLTDNVSSLFNQTYYMTFNNMSCDFDNMIEELPGTDPKYVNFNCYDLENNASKRYGFDKTQMFTTSNNDVTEITINIPQEANNNISRIVFFLNNQIDNSDMLRTLGIRILKKTENSPPSSLANWSLTSYVKPITDPITNVTSFILTNIPRETNIVTFSLPSAPTTPTDTTYPSTTLGTSKFKNINSNSEKFVDVIAKSATKELIPVPPIPVPSEQVIETGTGTTTTSSPTGTGTTTTSSPTSSPTETGTTTTSSPTETGTTTTSSPTRTGTTTTSSPTRTGTTTTSSPTRTGTTTTSTIPLTTYGYKIQTPINQSDNGTQTNLYQKNFDGTSNVYAPYIYYNM